MAEEFHESDVVFSDHHNHPTEAHECFDREVVVAPPQKKKNSPAVHCGKSMMVSGGKKVVASSVPVNIPQRMLRSSDSGDDEDDDEEEMVPPHVIVGRRVAGKMAYSVCTGHGRTLKGRDLSQVRNSILRMTGFLEA